MLNQQYVNALERALSYMEMEDGYLSSLKQAGSDFGIPYGDEMQKFVTWAETKLGIKE